jgi:hypothetical protein
MSRRAFPFIDGAGVLWTFCLAFVRLRMVCYVIVHLPATDILKGIAIQCDLCSVGSS